MISETEAVLCWYLWIFMWFLLIFTIKATRTRQERNPRIEKQLTFLKETCAGEALFLFERWLNAKSWFNTYDFCELYFKSPWWTPKASRKKGVEWQTKRATFPLGAISTSCLVPSSQGLSSGLLWFVWFLFWGPFLFTRLWRAGGVGGLCGGGGIPSFLSTWDPVDNPGPAHCIECTATVSTVMLVNNSYSWNPLRWLLTVCAVRPGSFLDDLKWQQSLSTLENLHISASATHLQKEPQVLPEMVKV